MQSTRKSIMSARLVSHPFIFYLKSSSVFPRASSFCKVHSILMDDSPNREHWLFYECYLASRIRSPGHCQYKDSKYSPMTPDPFSGIPARNQEHFFTSDWSLPNLVWIARHKEYLLTYFQKSVLSDSIAELMSWGTSALLEEMKNLTSLDLQLYFPYVVYWFTSRPRHDRLAMLLLS